MTRKTVDEKAAEEQAATDENAKAAVKEAPVPSDDGNNDPETTDLSSADLNRVSNEPVEGNVAPSHMVKPTGSVEAQSHANQNAGLYVQNGAEATVADTAAAKETDDGYATEEDGNAAGDHIANVVAGYPADMDQNTVIFGNGHGRVTLKHIYDVGGGRQRFIERDNARKDREAEDREDAERAKTEAYQK